jgi:hypothetical protein
MLSDYFRSPQTIDRFRNGSVGPFIEGFVADLESAGYSKIAIRAHIGTSAHLCHWACAKNLTLSDFDDSVRARFLKHL